MLQTAKVIGATYFVLVAILSVGVFIGSLIIPGLNPPFAQLGVMTLVLPFLQGLLGFVTTAIFCLIYNFVASKIGGIEFHLSDHHKS